MSDASGNLLFYTDGKVVYNRLGVIMPSGGSIVPFNTSSTTQAAIIIPVLSYPDKYYVFSLESYPNVYGGQLSYCIVDMTLAGGMGDVVPATINTFVHTGLSEKMTAVPGNNCDIWLLLHDRELPQFIAYDITAAGLGTPVVSTATGEVPSGLGAYKIGAIKISPDGTKVANCVMNGGYGGSLDRLEILDFSTTTGQVTGCMVLNNFVNQYDAEFSPDSRMLYSRILGGQIFQYDLGAGSLAAIIASQYTVTTSPDWGGQMKLGPDGKIYCQTDNLFLDRIDNPNSAGAACNYTFHAMAMPGKYIGMPNAVTRDVGPVHITGGLRICMGGATTVLSSTTPGGSWSSSNPPVATVSPTGVVTSGLTSGTATITYTALTGCFVTAVVTVDPMPVISGPHSMCIADPGPTLTATPSGGTWLSSDPSVAGIVPASGTIYAVSVGDVVITYTSPGGCMATYTFTVNPMPDPISGIFELCEGGFTTTLTDPTPGGTWTSTNITVATIDGATGLVTTGTAGTTIIKYTLPSGCSVLIVFVVDPTPVISGPHSMCMSDPPVSLTVVPLGGMWASSDPSVAGIDPLTGIVWAVSPGVVTITYTSPAGCVATYTFTVNPLPAPIIGTFHLCEGGATTTLSDPTTGGTWSSTVLSVAGIGATTGLVTSGVAGTTTITYTLLTGCSTSVPFVVDPTPVISGPHTMCLMAPPVLLTATPAGGTWVSSNPLTAAIGLTSGIVTSGSPGTVTITYTSPAGCIQTYAFTVYPLPDPVISINPSPSPEICVEQTTLIYIDPLSVPGCTLSWSSSDITVATVTPMTGTMALITGVGAGTATITCVATSVSTGCSGSVTFVITVHPLPVVTITSVPPAVSVPGGGSVVFTCTDAELTAHCTTPVTYAWTPTSYMTPSSGTTPVVTVAPPVSTTYTVTVTDIASPHCTSWATVNVTPIKKSCVCEAINSGVAIHPFAPTGTITTVSAPFYTPGNYYMQNNVLITGAPGDVVHLTGCVIFIDAMLKIEVDPGVTLVLDNCHLFCCNPDMWIGIILKPGSPGWYGQIELLNNTMIEDARIAISMPVAPVWPGIPPPPPPPGTLIINSHGATLNKNIVGMSISDYTFPTVPVLTPASGYSYPTIHVPCYPFVIENTVFTSRDFYSYNITGPITIANSWPYKWPGTNTPDGLKTAWTPPGPYDAPHNIDNPAACITGAYPPTLCNSSLPADQGIQLAGVGTTTGTLGTAVYSGIVIGSLPVSPANEEMNMFDNLDYGIYALNSNVVPRNGVYLHIGGSLNLGAAGSPGVAIYAENTNPTGVNCLYSLWMYGSDGSLVPKKGGVTATSSKFYDCNTALLTSEYYHVKAEFASVMSTQSSGSLGTPAGMMGYSVSSSHYYDVQLNYNKMYNIANGIACYAPPPVIAPLYGEIEIKGNNISPTSTGGSPTIGEYVQQAITVNGTVGPIAALHVVPGSQVNVEFNRLDHVLNGIDIRGINYQTQPVVCNNNTVSVDQDLVFPAVAPQTGIIFTNIDPGFILENTVTGPGSAVPTPPSHSGAYYGLPIIEAIHVNGLNGSIATATPMVGSTVGCNTVSQINTGFYFENFAGFQWINNSMDHNAYGYVVSGGIGDQLSSSAYSDNRWLPAAGFWTATGPTPNYQTYTMGVANPAWSRLFVDPSSVVFNPTENGTEPGATGPYTLGPTIIPLSSALHPVCPALPPTSVGFKESDSSRNTKPAITGAIPAQGYTLYPNPSDGRITLKQLRPDAAPVKIEVLNAVGQVVYKSEVKFDNGETRFNMQKQPGMYLLKLADASSGLFTIKFTIN